MKKLLLSVVVLLLAIVLTGCENKEEKTFKATILECREDSMIVEPDKDESEYKSSDQFSLSFPEGYNSCQVDGKVKITYSGLIAESYPAQINAIKIEDIK